MPRLHHVGLTILSLMTVEWKFIYICKYLEREEKRRCYLSPTIVKICRFAFRFTDGERCMKWNMYLACVGAHACGVVIVVVVFTPRSSFPPPTSQSARILISGRWKAVFEKLYVISVSFVWSPVYMRLGRFSRCPKSHDWLSCLVAISLFLFSNK